MKKYYAIISIFSLMLITSCTKYNVTGTSSLQNMDGHMLYLKGIVNDELCNIDSCEVVHGKFKFSGTLDSVQVVTLCIDDSPIMPLVLEDGDVTVELNEQRLQCKGTPLNDTLSAFNKRYETLMAPFDDLTHQQSQAIMNGEDMDVVNQRLESIHNKLVMQEDRMLSAFIADNFDNCLGPYVFQIATSGYQYPVLTPWIEALMTKASENFKNSPYVKEYMQLAKQNQDIMTGVAEVPQQPQQPPMLPQNADGRFDGPPTPNEMAKPVE